jgi:L,D-peptidoglycan transpeptidase YkuD (ErfK/YbiS/YcfS/YnhG family)
VILRVDSAARLFHVGDEALPCMIGRGGAGPADDKREGDGCTPIGRWPLRGALLRHDRVSVTGVALPWRWIDQADGWSDDPADPEYNRPVRHPHRFSAERLWRDDGAYDVIVALGYNDAAPRPGAGSAIFLHCTDFARPTEGCVAIAREALIALLPRLTAKDVIEIV